MAGKKKAAADAVEQAKEETAVEQAAGEVEITLKGVFAYAHRGVDVVTYGPGQVTVPAEVAAAAHDAGVAEEAEKGD